MSSRKRLSEKIDAARAGQDEGVRVIQTQARDETASAKAGDELVAAWESIRAGLRRDCGPRTFDGWLRPIRLGQFNADTATLTLELPSQFMADWVQTHFADRLALAWRSTMPAIRGLVIATSGDGPRTAREEEIPAPAAAGGEQGQPEPVGLYALPLEPRYEVLWVQKDDARQIPDLASIDLEFDDPDG